MKLTKIAAITFLVGDHVPQLVMVFSLLVRQDIIQTE
jgi:hypothetical protein